MFLHALTIFVVCDCVINDDRKENKTAQKVFFSLACLKQVECRFRVKENGHESNRNFR